MFRKVSKLVTNKQNLIIFYNKILFSKIITHQIIPLKINNNKTNRFPNSILLKID